ncbi:MAG: hypothetical protein IJ300_02050 [Clostridia bacterium]|nr:hypothetical protein [Clostridia bacterium]
MDNQLNCCCFIGHRKIEETHNLTNHLYNVIENLIVQENVNVFLFGSKSEFNNLCYRVVSRLKEQYRNIQRIYVRAEFPYIDNSYKAYLQKRYENSYYPDKIISAGKAAYIERNYEMINNSKYCIMYYDDSYAPPRRKKSSKDLTDYQPQSGTKLAYNYAVRKCNVINVFENVKF